MALSVRRLDWHFIALQIGFWAMFAAAVPYQAPLLLNRGFTSGQIGVIVAVRCLAGIILQPMLGGWADRHPEVPLKKIVCLCLVLSLVVGILFFAFPGISFPQTALVFVVLGGFELSAYPLMDAMAVQFINAGYPVRYSLGRGIGAFSYAVICILLGLQSGRFGVETTLVTHAALVAAEIVLVATFPTYPAAVHQAAGEEAPTEQPHTIPEILRSNPRFTLMLCAILLGLTAILPISSFLVNILQDKGGGDEQLGLALFLMGASELPGALLFNKFQRRGVSSDKLLLVSLIFGALKALAMLLAPTPGILLLVQPIQMLGYGIFTPASMYFVNEAVPKVDQVKGQTLMMVASNGLGGMLGGLMGGKALDLGQAAGVGSSWMLLSCFACGAVGVVLACIAIKRKHT